MASETNPCNLVAVVGAGPAGLYAARQLASNGVEVVVFNRDIKPGGLAEYGIYYDKYKMKDGLRKQFRQILSLPNLHYLGNVTIGQNGDLYLDELAQLGFQAVLVTAGAQGTKWLGLPGENLRGVYHAKDLVYHYNKLPPYSTMPFAVRGRVALVGVGNVMMDIAHWAIHDLKVDEVIAVARRGPAEVKFTKKEMEYVIANLDVAALDRELARCAPFMAEVNQDVQAAREYILSASSKAAPPVSGTRFSFDFLASPTAMLGNEQGEVTGLEVEDTKLVLKGDDTKAVGMGSRRVLAVDTVVFCIGDKVDENFGLPVMWNAFVKSSTPRYPVEGISYEAFDPQAGQPVEGVFVAGWSREASSGLVGVARKDGESGAQAVLEYLKTKPALSDTTAVIAALYQRLAQTGKRVIAKDDVARLESAEQAIAQQQGLPEYKMKTNQEMLAAIWGEGLIK
jgi:ferredoxin--NADP+ reductase